MAESDNSMSCTAKSWAMAILGGLVIGIVVWVVSTWGFAASATLAIVIALVVGLFLSLVACSDGAKSGGAAVPGPGAAATAAPTAAASAVTPMAHETPHTDGAADQPTAKADAGTDKGSDGSVVKPSAPLAGQAELAARKGSWKYDKDGGEIPAKDAPAKKAAPAKAAAAASPAASEPAPDKAKRAPVAGDGKPELMDKPRPEGADDLKLIGGVGPKLEQTLNELGIWHFSQVAGWRKKEIEWVDSRLRFKGRIERDDWMSQAKILAKGGETEFSKKKKK